MEICHWRNSCTSEAHGNPCWSSILRTPGQVKKSRKNGKNRAVVAMPLTILALGATEAVKAPARMHPTAASILMPGVVPGRETVGSKNPSMNCSALPRSRGKYPMPAWWPRMTSMTGGRRVRVHPKTMILSSLAAGYPESRWRKAVMPSRGST